MKTGLHSYIVKICQMETSFGFIDLKLWKQDSKNGPFMGNIRKIQNFLKSTTFIALKLE